MHTMASFRSCGSAMERAMKSHALCVTFLNLSQTCLPFGPRGGRMHIHEKHSETVHSAVSKQRNANGEYNMEKSIYHVHARKRALTEIIK